MWIRAIVLAFRIVFTSRPLPDISWNLIVLYVIPGSILLSISLIILVTSNWFRRIRLALILRGPKAYPIIGNCNLATNTEEMLNIANKAYHEYGPIFRVWISFVPVFIVMDPKDLQNVLGSSKNINKTFFYSLMKNFLGPGLLTISGHKWRKHRKLLQPSFNLNILETYVDCFAEHSAHLVKRFETVTSNEKDINITRFINNTVTSILNETIIGIATKQDSHDDSPFRQGRVTSPDRIVHPWLMFDSIFKFTKSGQMENSQKEKLNSFTRQIIEQRKNERKLGLYKKDKISLLERMLDIQEENLDFTDDDILNEITTFMLAGQESVATTIAFCLFCIAKHPHIQDKIYEEQCSIFSNSTRLPNIDDLQSMIYLEQCIKETLRLYPSVPLMARKLGESIKVGEHILPIGSHILITPFVTQRIKKFYPNPEIFDPERFTVDHCEKRPPLSFIPFSAGPRNCIGNKFAMLEMKTILSTLIRSFETSLKSEYEIKLAFRITLRARGGIWIKMKPRNSHS